MRKTHQHRGVNYAFELGDEPYWSVTEMKAMDEAFCTRLAKAIKRGRERGAMGVVTAPCTQRPAFVTPLLRSGCGSSAAQCAELSRPGAW